jgi:hypothetical protein
MAVGERVLDDASADSTGGAEQGDEQERWGGRSLKGDAGREMWSMSRNYAGVGGAGAGRFLTSP